jgi:CubicO group peptidase (beta-lactamase class C family)
MDQVIQYYVDKQQFMGSVLVARGDAVLFSKAYGFANLEWNVPNTLSTKFRIGSLSKQFTAAAVLLLEEHGKLKLEDPVRKYYQDAPTAWSNITLFQLLTHTSGIPDFTGLPDFYNFSARRKNPDELVKFFRDQPLEFDPGTQFHYSNSGYALLGVVIESAGGLSYAEFLKQNIFKPLAMNDSGYDENAIVISRRAAGYRPGRDGPLNAEYADMSVPFAAGALYSTVEDLLRWERGLFESKLLSEKSLEKMTTAFKGDYGLGLYARKGPGARKFEHSGGINGFRSKLMYYPDDAVTVVALSNIVGPGADEVVDKLGALAHGEKVVLQSERVEVAVPLDTLMEYAGTYELRPGFDLTFTVVGDRLLGAGTGQPPDPLYAETQALFFSRVVDADLEFVRDASGKVSYVVLHQGGIHQKAAKKQ